MTPLEVGPAFALDERSDELKDIYYIDFEF